MHGTRAWITIIATTTVGTTLADFADRSLGIGYAGGAALLLALLGSPSCSPRPLGTALGDGTADSAGLGYTGSAALFWTAFVLTRPLGAVGD
jgi:uncharacterized membrane-anchored protein